MIGQRLLSRSPWVYVSIYLGVFLIFALVFRLLAGDFCHATAAFEPAIRADKERLQDELTAAIRSQFERGHHGKIAVFEQWLIESNELQVVSVDSRDDGLAFDLRYIVHQELAGRETMRAVWKSTIVLSKRASRVTEFPPAGPITYLFPNIDPSETVGLPVPLNDVVLSILLPAGQSGVVPGQPVVVLPLALFNRVNAYWAALHGFPGSSTGEWGRMLYLSAATITTLGYGDVVPLTTRARLLVGIEALLGIALIGFFLNACAAARQTSPR